MMMSSLHSGLSWRQRGLTLVEFMVAIVLGMIMVAAMATLIANQSTSRAEVDRAGKMIENGRYALQAIAQDVELAGFWGELGSAPAVPATLPNPCATAVGGTGNLQEAMGLHVQGYDAPAALPAGLSCVKNFKPGTDILVVRHVDPVTSDLESGSPAAVNWSLLAPGQVYLQTGISGASLSSVLAVANGSADATTFNLTTRAGGTATPRRYVVHIYYIAKCSVEVSGSCTNADGGNPIPTLKRVDLGVVGGVTQMNPPVTIAEGVENMQIDYGLDSDNDGAADGVDGTGSAFTVNDWPNVMTMKIYLLARSTEQTPGYDDLAGGVQKTYVMGTAGSVSVAAADAGYRRHLFVQSVRMVNPTGRRAP